VNLRTQKNLQTGTPFHGHGAARSLWLVVGGPGRVWLARPGFSSRAFTLIELVLVLALLAMAVAVAAPSLSRFFRGRTLDNEARRLLSLTRYAQSRAVSEGVPMLLWLRPDTGAYGLMSETTFTDTDARAVNYELNTDVQMEVDSLTSEPTWKKAALATGSKQYIRFTPDGFVADESPAWVWLKSTDGSDATWLVLNENRLNYELGSLQPDTRR